MYILTAAAATRILEGQDTCAKLAIWCTQANSHVGYRARISIPRRPYECAYTCWKSTRYSTSWCFMSYTAWPLKTRSAGPVMNIVPSSVHSMSRGPPGKSTCTTAPRSSRPSSTPATTSAHAPVPQARVRPAPRSQTLMRTCVREMTSTNSVFVFAGNVSCASNSGPTS